MQETKLQIRARLLSAVSQMQNPSNKSPQAFDIIIDPLRDIEDKNAILEILIKEFKKDISEEKSQILFCIFHALLDKNVVEEALLKELANPTLSDSIKSHIINVLRGYGNHLNYDDYLKYLQNPQEVIDADTSRLLSNAIINPEAQIDFLDFINALPVKEAKMLLESLNNDYEGDNLANILSPLILSKPFSEIAFDAIRNIGESKSQLALHTLNYIIENVNDLKLKAHAQKSISLLKLSGIKEDNTLAFYKEILAQSPVYKCFTNLPDGHGNVGLIFSRRSDNGEIQMFTVVINDIDGIADCFGFNDIADSEFTRIVTKFFANDMIVEIKPEFCKYLLTNAEKTSRLMHEEIPYEYAAWKTITNDIEYEEINLNENADSILLSEFLMKQLYNAGYFDKWFFDEDESFSPFIQSLRDEDAIFNEPLPIENIFTPAIVKTIDYRLSLMSYCLRQEGHCVDADLIYSLTQNTEFKKKFYENILKKSIYEYFLNQKEQFYSTKHAASIFTRKKEEERKKIDINFVESVLSKIEEKWIDNE